MAECLSKPENSCWRVVPCQNGKQSDLIHRISIKFVTVISNSILGAKHKVTPSFHWSKNGILKFKKLWFFNKGENVWLFVTLKQYIPEFLFKIRWIGNTLREKWLCKTINNFDHIVTSHDFILFKRYVFNLKIISFKSVI